jgi:hypothetical protein
VLFVHVTQTVAFCIYLYVIVHFYPALKMIHTATFISKKNAVVSGASVPSGVAYSAYGKMHVAISQSQDYPDFCRKAKKNL